MKKLVLLLVVVLLMFGCGKSENRDNTRNTYRETARQATPQELEAESPLEYVSVESIEQTMNFWGTKSEYKVMIKNNARYTEYKDLTLKVQYLSQTGSVIGERAYTRYDYFQPNHLYEIGFELPTSPEGTKKYTVVIQNIVFSKGV